MIVTASACRSVVPCRNGTLSASDLRNAVNDTCPLLDAAPLCKVTALENFALVNLRGQLKLPQCGMNEVPWQSLVSSGVEVDMRNCPLSCSCRNAYISLSLHQHNLRYRIPKSYSCAAAHEKCEQGHLRLEHDLVPVKLDKPFDIVIDIDGGQVYPELLNKKRQYFIFEKFREHNFTEIVEERRVSLKVDSANEKLVGHLTFLCWHCQIPLVRKIEVHMETSLTVTIDDEASPDLSHMVIGGHPLYNISITVTDIEGKLSETHFVPSILHDDNPYNYFGALYIRPEAAHWTSYHRGFSVYLRSPLYTVGVENDETVTSGNFSFTVCNHILDDTSNTTIDYDYSENSTDCVTIFHFLNMTKTLPTERMFALPSSNWLIILLCVVGILSGILYTIPTRLRMRLVRNKFFQMLRMTGRLASGRRTSLSTEETMLRLEERASLSSSDYSGQIIPSINGASIQIHERIGKGAFGEVYCGSWDLKGERSVAVKAIYQADEQIEKEAQVLCSLDHPNIVRLYGMTRDGSRLLLVFEMMNLGDLGSYLRARAPQATNYSQFPPALVLDELRFIIRELAKGVRYLEAQQIVHRDLAARNCLVSGKTDLRCMSAAQRPPITVKISDFGMSRRLNYQAEYYQMMNQSLLPVRWLPPEAIFNLKFSHGSDIWALGVTMWEVFSFGEVPFDTLSNDEVVSYAMAGMRPPRPRACPPEIYGIMEKCWAISPDERISSEDILLHPSIAEETSNGVAVIPANCSTVPTSGSFESASGVMA